MGLHSVWGYELSNVEVSVIDEALVRHGRLTQSKEGARLRNLNYQF